MHLFYCSQIRVRLLSESIEETGIPQGRVGRHLYSERTLWTLRVSRLISNVSYETPAVRAPADLEEKLAWQCFLDLKKTTHTQRVAACWRVMMISPNKSMHLVSMITGRKTEAAHTNSKVESAFHTVWHVIRGWNLWRVLSVCAQFFFYCEILKTLPSMLMRIPCDVY